MNKHAIELYNLPKTTKITQILSPVEIDFGYKFNIDKKKNQILFIGRLANIKRPWIFCEIASKMPKYEFFLLGDYNKAEVDYIKTKNFLQKYKNNKNLHFLGHLEGEKKKQIIKESKIICQTSIHESLSIAILESLSYGTIPVTTIDLTGYNAKFGIYTGLIDGMGLEKNKVDLLINAIEKILNDNEFYCNKAKAAIEYIRKYHNISIWKKNMRQIIMENIDK